MKLKNKTLLSVAYFVLIAVCMAIIGNINGCVWDLYTISWWLGLSGTFPVLFYLNV